MIVGLSRVSLSLAGVGAGLAWFAPAADARWLGGAALLALFAALGMRRLGSASAPAGAAPAARVPGAPRVPRSAWLEGLFDGLPLSVIVVDPAARQVLDINPHAEREFGLKRGELAGRSVTEAFGAEVCAQVEAPMLRAVRQRRLVEHRVEWRIDGVTRLLRTRHFALRPQRGARRVWVTLAEQLPSAWRADRP